jgi:hypothetical protein
MKAKKLKYGIEHINRKLNRIEKKERLVKQLAEVVEEFTGWNVTRKEVCDNRGKLARNLFYKYGMEHGLLGCYLGTYCGLKGSRTAPRGRMRFTRSFKKHPENLEMWKRFSNFIKEKEDEEKEI